MHTVHTRWIQRGDGIGGGGKHEALATRRTEHRKGQIQGCYAPLFCGDTTQGSETGPARASSIGTSHQGNGMEGWEESIGKTGRARAQGGGTSGPTAGGGCDKLFSCSFFWPVPFGPIAFRSWRCHTYEPRRINSWQVMELPRLFCPALRVDESPCRIHFAGLDARQWPITIGSSLRMPQDIDAQRPTARAHMLHGRPLSPVELTSSVLLLTHVVVDMAVNLAPGRIPWWLQTLGKGCLELAFRPTLTVNTPVSGPNFVSNPPPATLSKVPPAAS